MEGRREGKRGREAVREGRREEERGSVCEMKGWKGGREITFGKL